VPGDGTDTMLHSNSQYPVTSITYCYY